MTVENLHDAIGLLPSDLIAKVDEKRCRKPKTIPFRRYAAIAASLTLVACGGYLAVRTYYLDFLCGGSKETAAEAPAAVMQAPAEANGFSITENAIADEAVPEAAAPIRGAEPEAAEDFTAAETYAAGEIPAEGEAEEDWEGYPVFPAEDVQYADTKNIGTAGYTSEPVLRVLRSPAELEEQRQTFGYCDLAAFDACAEHYTEEWFQTHDLLVVLVKGLPAEGSFSLASITESDGGWCIRFYSGGPYTGKTVDRFVFAALEKGQIPEKSRLFAMFEVP